jgi:hypothetical protein
MTQPLTTDRILIDLDGKPVWATAKQASDLNILASLNNGGIATVRGYQPTTDWKVVPTIDLSFISKFSTERLYDRKLEALKALAFNDLDIREAKILAMLPSDQHKLFCECVTKMIESMQKTLDGERNDAHRQGHDRCYVHTALGVKVHLVTEKGEDGLKHPVLVDGHPQVDSIMLSVIELGRKYVEKGERKVVNSGAKVLMDNAINSALKTRTCQFRTISLKTDNHNSLAIGGEVLDPQEVVKVQTLHPDLAPA